MRVSVLREGNGWYDLWDDNGLLSRLCTDRHQSSNLCSWPCPSEPIPLSLGADLWQNTRDSIITLIITPNHTYIVFNCCWAELALEREYSHFLVILIKIIARIRHISQ